MTQMLIGLKVQEPMPESINLLLAPLSAQPSTSGVIAFSQRSFTNATASRVSGESMATTPSGVAISAPKPHKI